MLRGRRVSGRLYVKGPVFGMINSEDMDTFLKPTSLIWTFLVLNLHYFASGSRNNHPWGIAYESEHCDFEIFKAQCGPGQIIMVQSAVYGHIRIGRCIERDLGHLGCKADVLETLEMVCSGKQTCEIVVTDERLRESRPCTKGVSLHLEVSYTCLNMVPGGNLCNPLPAHSTQSYISSLQIFKRHCNTDLEIGAKPVQSIEIAFIDLLPADKIEGKEEIGYLVDGDGTNIGSLTTGEPTSAHLSTSSTVSLMFDGSFTNHKFVLAYKATGCPDFTAPIGTTVQREDNAAIVTCSYNQLTWKLTCKGNQWLGVIGNCTSPVIPETLATTRKPKISPQTLELPKDVIYLIIVCTTIFLSVLVITIGYVSLKRARIEQKVKDQKDKEAEWDQGTTKMILIPKPRPNSDYLTPRCNPEGQGEPAPIYDTPLPDPPLISSLNRGTAKRNNEEDYINTMSSNSTDYTRKYFVLDKDYMNTNNLMDA